MSDLKRQLTVSEAAKELGVDYNTVLLRIQQRRLPAIKMGGTYIIQASDVAKRRRINPGAKATNRRVESRLQEPTTSVTQPTGEGNLTWPPGLQRTPKREVWFDRLAKLEPGLDIATIARKLDKPYFTVLTWAQIFGYRYPDNRRHARRGKESPTHL